MLQAIKAMPDQVKAYKTLVLKVLTAARKVLDNVDQVVLALNDGYASDQSRQQEL